jgi:hypothetical protein
MLLVGYVAHQQSTLRYTRLSKQARTELALFSCYITSDTINTMKTLLLSISALLTCFEAEAQTLTSPDSSLLAGPVQAARQRYVVDAPESRLLNGIAYVNHVSGSVRGRPFFQTGEPQAGKLDYDGQLFTGVPLLYEQVQDQVLLYGPAQAGPLQLVRQKVRAFELAGHRFVRLPTDSAGVVREGFYDLVVDGPAQLFVKRTKKVQAATGGYSLTGEYEEKTQFFVWRNKIFYEINTLKQTLAALSDRKAQIQAYARENRLRYVTEDREASLTALVKHYNTLANR